MSLHAGVTKFKDDTAPVKRGNDTCVNFTSKIGPYGGLDPSDKVVVGMGVHRRLDGGSWSTMMNTHALLSVAEATGNGGNGGGSSGGAMGDTAAGPHKLMLPKAQTSASAAYTAVGVPGGKYDLLAYNTLMLSNEVPFGAVTGVAEMTGKFVAGTKVSPTLVVHPGPMFSTSATRF